MEDPPDISLLVHDMPLEDIERCGRLRDHMTMLVEGAEVRIQGIKATSKKRGEALEYAGWRITEALKEIDSAQRQRLVETRIAFSDLIDKIEKAMISTAMTESQERFLSAIVRDGVEEIIKAQSNEIDIQNKLTAIINELRGLLGVK
jgi:hypothetical protein